MSNEPNKLQLHETCWNNPLLQSCNYTLRSGEKCGEVCKFSNYCGKHYRRHRKNI